MRHTVRVRAESLFEAAAAALGQFRECRWLETQPGPATKLEVKVRGPATKHTVSVQQLQRWAESTAVTPADRVKRQNVKRLLSPTSKPNGRTP